MNYGQVKAAVSAYANRDDLTALFPTFLEMAEHQIYSGAMSNVAPQMQVPPLRLSSMIAVITPTTTSLPADFLEMKRVSAIVAGQKKPLDFLPFEASGLSENRVGSPSYFSLNGNSIVYSPTFTNAVEMVYYARFTSPVLDADTNWLLINAAAVYLSALLVEVAVYTRDDGMHAQQSMRYVSAMNALQAQDDGNKHSGATLRIRSDGRRLL